MDRYWDIEEATVGEGFLTLTTAESDDRQAFIRLDHIAGWSESQGSFDVLLTTGTVLTVRISAEAHPEMWADIATGLWHNLRTREVS